MANSEYVVNSDVVIDDQPHPAGSILSLADDVAAPLVASGDIVPVPAAEPKPVAAAAADAPPGYKVRRPVIIGGKPAAVGAIVELDPAEAAELLVSGQVAAEGG